MKKFLIIILALAFAVGLTCAAYAEVQNVKVSGDITAIGFGRDLHLNKNTAITGKNSGIASIARVKVSADLTDNVSTTVRLLNERYWGTENATSGDTEVDIDLAYATLKEFFYSPLSITVGRQELHMGSEMVVGDPDTNNMVNALSGFANTTNATTGKIDNGDPDFSVRKAFDAVRATLNYDPLVVEGIASRVNESTNSKVLNDKTDLYGIDANYKLGRKNTNLEGYWYRKVTGRKATTSNNKKDLVDTFGGRIVSEPIDNLTISVEGAYQGGVYNSYVVNQKVAKRSAWATELGASYLFKKVKYTPLAMVGYANFSGSRTNFNNTIPDNSKIYTGWDPMYENQKYGDIANAQFNQTNVQLFTAAGTVKPLDDLSLKGEYYAYWWNKVYADGEWISTVRGDRVRMQSKKFAGQEIDLTATYDYTEDVQFGLLYGIFLPGSAFADYSDTGAGANGSAKNAVELIGSMKVTF